MTIEPDQQSFLEKLVPFLEKALLTPQGAGLAAIGIGGFLRATHVAAHWVKDPSFIGPPTPNPPATGTSGGGSGWIWVAESGGLDLRVWNISLGSTPTIPGVPSWLLTIINLLEPLAALGSSIISAIPGVPSTTNTVTIWLGDLLIIGGLATASSGSVQALTSLAPKV